MSARTGLEVVTYNVSSLGTPVYTNPIGTIREETVNLTKVLADVTDRRANGWRLQKGTLKEGSVDAQLIYDPEDADFTDIQTAFFADTKLPLFFSDGDATTAGTWQGLMAAFHVSEFSQPRNLEDAVVVDISLVPDLEDTTNEAPRWHSVTVV
ncbi:MAG: hypothetical protein AAFX06_14960 [Planctomycetota bacterium]